MSTRSERVASQIKEDMAMMLREYQRNNIITVTHVVVTDDLGIAKIYVSVLGGDEEQTFQNLKSKEDELRYKLADKVRHQLRRVPELHLFEDNSAEHAQRMEEIFKRINPDDDEPQSEA